ncbi:MAG TPA: hypothetical protein VHH52_03420, partial [Pseudonocardiaceae bacterium]|nr:hypothetical protein [Pseudonocardiaceae bacterium]
DVQHRDVSTDRTTEYHGGAQPDKRFQARERLIWWQVIAAGAVVAAVGNLVIFFIGGAAGASFAFLDRGALHEIGSLGCDHRHGSPLVVEPAWPRRWPTGGPE